MYLKEVFIENLGPLHAFAHELPFSLDGRPKPLILVGQNGSGKTTLLSVVADALFETASQHFADVVATATGLSRHWFRVVGGATTTTGASGSCAVMRFDHNNQSLFFKEASGTLPVADVRQRAPESLRQAIDWADDGEAKKTFVVDAALCRDVFSNETHVFFPASRAEIPSWLNTDSLAQKSFNLRPRFSTELGKAIYVERGLDELKQWLLALLLDARVDFEVHFGPQGNEALTVKLAENWVGALAPQAIWRTMIEILRAVLNEPDARLGWISRKERTLAVFRGNAQLAPSIESLSAGQSGLLNLFGTLLRYGDLSGAGTTAALTRGICLIDEIDAHMHIDLQNRALPKLIKMFPNVQFIVTSHSPLFVLGMEKEFGSDGIQIVEMPSGVPIQAEAFSEFDRALGVLRNTVAFNEAMANAASEPGKVLVLLEGETDSPYMTAAAQLLGRPQLLEAFEFQWIGAKQAPSGQAYNTGKTALTNAFNLYRAKPDLLHRTVLLLYDNDANKAPEDFSKLHVRSIPTNAINTLITEGIENLLPEEVVTESMYDVTEKKQSGGGSTTIRTLNKMRLCKHLCESKREAADFEHFKPTLDLIEAIQSA